MIPVKGPIVSSHFGWRTLNGQRNWHIGTDYISADPAREVRAILPGEVCIDFDGYEHAKRWSGPHTAGNYVCIKHETPVGVLRRQFGLHLFWRYLHLEQNRCTLRQLVKQGDIIGVYGDVGFSYGPHLHLEAYSLDWQVVDHRPILLALGIPV